MLDERTLESIVSSCFSNLFLLLFAVGMFFDQSLLHNMDQSLLMQQLQQQIPPEMMFGSNLQFNPSAQQLYGNLMMVPYMVSHVRVQIFLKMFVVDFW